VGNYREKIKNALLKYAEYNVKYFDAPIPIARLIKKYFLPEEYEKLPKR
jgi:hypothetical protein